MGRDETSSHDRTVVEIRLLSILSRLGDIIFGVLGVLVAAAFLIGIGALVWVLVNRWIGIAIMVLAVPLCFFAARSSFRSARKRPSIPTSVKKSAWTKGYLQGGGWFFIASPIWIPIAEGEGFRPLEALAEDPPSYALAALGGIASLLSSRRY